MAEDPRLLKRISNTMISTIGHCHSRRNEDSFGPMLPIAYQTSLSLAYHESHAEYYSMDDASVRSLQINTSIGLYSMRPINNILACACMAFFCMEDFKLKTPTTSTLPG